VCNKLLDEPPTPFPALPANYLGPQPGFESLGLVSEMEDPYQVISDGELTASFVTSERVRLTAQLIHVAAATSEDLSEYVLQQADSQLIKFIVRLPKLGSYKLQACFSLTRVDTSYWLHIMLFSFFLAHTTVYLSDGTIWYKQALFSQKYRLMFTIDD